MPDPKESKIYAGERFRANPYPFAYTVVRDPQTGETVYKRTVSPQIPNRIPMTGNRKELESFYARNRETLTAADKLILSNLDTANSSYENGDLIMKVLPNTTIRNVSLNPVDEEMALSGMSRCRSRRRGIRDAFPFVQLRADRKKCSAAYAGGREAEARLPRRLP